jgi:hypothetical protein
VCDVWREQPFSFVVFPDISSLLSINTRRHKTHTHTHICIYIYIERERGERERENQTDLKTKPDLVKRLNKKTTDTVSDLHANGTKSSFGRDMDYTHREFQYIFESFKENGNITPLLRDAFSQIHWSIKFDHWTLHILSY